MKKVKIAPTFEDEALEVATFIQKLGQVCDFQLNALFVKCKSNNWVEGMEDNELYDMLFDYCYNSGDRPPFFGEYLPDVRYNVCI